MISTNGASYALALVYRAINLKEQAEEPGHVAAECREMCARGIGRAKCVRKAKGE